MLWELSLWRREEPSPALVEKPEEQPPTGDSRSNPIHPSRHRHPNYHPSRRHHPPPCCDWIHRFCVWKEKSTSFLVQLISAAYYAPSCYSDYLLASRWERKGKKSQSSISHSSFSRMHGINKHIVCMRTHPCKQHHGNRPKVLVSRKSTVSYMCKSGLVSQMRPCWLQRGGT